MSGKVSSQLNGAIESYLENSGDITAHLSNKSNPHEVTKEQVGLSSVTNDKQATEVQLQTHTTNVTNPHSVTKAQVGLSNVTNDKQATEANLNAHTANVNNPHAVTKTQVGLANVTNVEQASKTEFNSFVSSTNANINKKVDKVTGKGLSTNDFTETQRAKLDSITVTEEGLEIDLTWDNIANKPPITGGGAAHNSVALLGATTEGYGDNFACGQLAKAVGRNSIAIGVSSKAGTYTFPIASRSSVDKTYTISTVYDISDIQVEDKLSFVGTSALYIDAATVTAVDTSTNTITVDNFFTAESEYSELFVHRKTLNTANSPIGNGSIVLGGSNNVTLAGSSAATGVYTIAATYGQFACGKYNIPCGTDPNDYTTTTAFIIGNGYYAERSNAFRVQWDGNVYTAGGAFNSTGADYGEYFEWDDGNLNNEDRRGLFVTLDGDKIRIASADDSYILGIISSNPSVVGDSHDDVWCGKYLTDIFGKVIMHEITVPPVYNKSELILHEHKEIVPIINPNYDASQKYTKRSARPEWSVVGMMGKIIVIDDGSCAVNGYCKCGDNGVAEASEDGYRVMKRIDETHIQILFK